MYEHLIIQADEKKVLGVSFNLKQTIFWVARGKELEINRGIVTERTKKDIINFLLIESKNIESGCYKKDLERTKYVIKVLTELDLKRHYYNIRR